MRIDVYAEELPLDPFSSCNICFVTKQVDNRTFYGIRMYLESSPELHHTDTDDDRSAITFWVPWRDGENHHNIMIYTLRCLMDAAILARKDDRKHG